MRSEWEEKQAVICERCWGTAYLRMMSGGLKTQMDHYLEILNERKGSHCHSPGPVIENYGPRDITVGGQTLRPGESIDLREGGAGESYTTAEIKPSKESMICWISNPLGRLFYKGKEVFQGGSSKEIGSELSIKKLIGLTSLDRWSMNLR